MCSGPASTCGATVASRRRSWKITARRVACLAPCTMATTASRSARESLLSQSLVSIQFSSVQFKMVSMQNIGRAHMHSTLTLRSSPSITFEAFAWALSPSLALTVLEHGERGLHDECTEPRFSADSSWTWSTWIAQWSSLTGFSAFVCGAICFKCL